MTPPDLTAKTLRQAALNYAAAGWSVLPLHTVRPNPEIDGRLVCTCGANDCRWPGRHPNEKLARKKWRDATRDIGKIGQWWPDDSGEGWNIGIRTGRHSGIYVLDVGAVAVPQVLPTLPETLSSWTGSGAIHLYYRLPPRGHWPNTTARFAPAVNTRGDDGFIVAPPSLHASGLAYEWVAPAKDSTGNDKPRDIADLPAEAQARLAPETKAPVTSPSINFFATDRDAEEPEHPSQLDPYVICKSRVDGDDVAPALAALAWELARRGVPRPLVIEAVTDANDRNGAPPLSASDARSTALHGCALEVQRQRKLKATPPVVADAGTVEGQEIEDAVARRKSAENPGPHDAVKAYLLTRFSVVHYDDSSKELEVLWLHDGSVSQIPMSETRAIEPAVLRQLGPLAPLAARISGNAKERTVVQVLRDLAHDADAKPSNADDSEEVALVDAILALDVPEEVTNKFGDLQRYTTLVSLLTRWVPKAGLGIVQYGGRDVLLVSVPRLAGGALSRSAQFRAKTSAQLLLLLSKAPGYMGEARNKRDIEREVGRGRIHAVDLHEFRRITGRNIKARDEATGPQTSFVENGGSSGSSAQISSENAMNKGTSTAPAESDAGGSSTGAGGSDDMFRPN